MDGQENSDNLNLRVASFSAYLNSPDENFVLKLTGGVCDPSLDNIFSPEETPRLMTTTTTKGGRSREGELGVFGADKYFNMKLGYHSPITETREGDKIEVYHYMSPKPRSGTAPSVASESSWNSQSALLPRLVKNPSRTKQKKAFFSGFGCNGPCLDKKAVHVNEVVPGPRRDSFQFVTSPVVFDAVKKSPVQSQENFEFPFPKSRKQNSEFGNPIERKEEKEEEDLPRQSIEVFGSQKKKKSDSIATNLERKLSMLTWDAIPKSQKSSASTLVGSGGPCDDIQSDASSDLFEIDPLSGTGFTLLGIPPLEEDLYEPSEASIQWSVVTASAADFSVVSDYDEKLISGEINSRRTIPKMAKTKNNVVQKEAQKSRPGGLLGCKNQKAVSVAEAAYRTNEKTRTLMPRKEFEFPPLGQRHPGSLRMNLNVN